MASQLCRRLAHMSIVASSEREGANAVEAQPASLAFLPQLQEKTTVLPLLNGQQLFTDAIVNTGVQTSTGYHADLSRTLKGVVKIFTTSANPNFSAPWQMHAQTKSTATGFIVEPLAQRRILTNAHAVANQVIVSVRKDGNAKKYSAKVVAVGHECDIAMLTVEDDEFWEDVCPLEINGLPALQDSVTVVGFPTGGDNVCVTKGVVSRMDRQQYSHGRTSLLTLQIDAAINSGNSGGPVVRDGKVVGIAFQCLTAGESIGYIIPVPVVQHFLEDLDRHEGKYTGFCELGISWQTLENLDMKMYLGMPKKMTGVFVTKTEPLYHAAEVLFPGDVITHINGVELADDGTFLFREATRIDFRHLVSMKFNGETCRLKVWRNGQHGEVDVRVSTPKQLVPIHSHDVMPTYFIHAGLVFTKLTVWYLKSVYGCDWQCKSPIKLYEKAIAGSKSCEDEEVVIVSKVLASEVNTGYQDLGNIQVLRVNGIAVHNLRHLADLIEQYEGEFLRLELEWNKVVILNHAKAKRVNQAILEQNSIPRPHSKGLFTAPFVPERHQQMQQGEEHRDDEEPLVAAAVCKL